MSEQELREQIIEFGKKLVTNRLIQSTWGNISVRLDDEYFLITPSGSDYFKTEPSDIVKVRISDLHYEGNNKPSSEKLLHRNIYASRNVNAIVHTHSSNLQVFSCCNEDLVYKGKTIYPCSKYAVSGSKKLAINALDGMSYFDGVILANHGFMACSNNLENAFNKCVEAERIAGIVLGIKND